MSGKNASSDDTQSTRTIRTQKSDEKTQSVRVPAAESRPSDPILGLVVLFAESSDSGGRYPSECGRVHALRKGDVFFAGKSAPTEVERSDGSKTQPASVHLFPLTSDYAHISRRHVTVEFIAPGQASVRDHSTNGTTLVVAKQHLKKTERMVSGTETIVLGEDISGGATAADLERTSRYQLTLLVPESAGDVKAAPPR
ncbi:MAG: FHA domain-containing protein [bacterium]